MIEHFDPALVRSAVPNLLLAREAVKHVKVVLTGEGADELFAGYEYVHAEEFSTPDTLQAELVRSIEGLHELNLQRCDRATMNYGLEARVPFLDATVMREMLALPGGVEAQDPRADREAAAARGVRRDGALRHHLARQGAVRRRLRRRRRARQAGGEGEGQGGRAGRGAPDRRARLGAAQRRGDRLLPDLAPDVLRRPPRRAPSARSPPRSTSGEPRPRSPLGVPGAVVGRRLRCPTAR